MTRLCTRCGIESIVLPLCDDCADVTNVPRSTNDRLVGNTDKGFHVTSPRSTRERLENREAILADVRRLTAAGISANEIALQVGVCTSTVHRMRRET